MLLWTEWLSHRFIIIPGISGGFYWRNHLPNRACAGLAGIVASQQPATRDSVVQFSQPQSIKSVSEERSLQTSGFTMSDISKPRP